MAAKALEQVGVTLELAREKVTETIGASTTVLTGSPPFTPRAKKVLELALRESLQLGDDGIGTEHLLLGVLDESQGVAAAVLRSLGADDERVRAQVGTLLGKELPPGARWVSKAAPATPSGRFVACSFCGRRPPDTGRMVASGGAVICEHCVVEWHRKLNEPDESPPDQAGPHFYEPAVGNENEPAAGEEDQ